VDRLHRRRATETEFRLALESSGFGQVEITETHRVHAHAASAIIRARKL
jgi:arsenite methyltransferase